MKAKLMMAHAAAMSRVAGRFRKLIAGTHDFSEQSHSLDHKTCPIEIRVEIHHFLREFFKNDSAYIIGKTEEIAGFQENGAPAQRVIDASPKRRREINAFSGVLRSAFEYDAAQLGFQIRLQKNGDGRPRHEIRPDRAAKLSLEKDGQFHIRRFEPKINFCLNIF
jgi:hypothetical protein